MRASPATKINFLSICAKSEGEEVCVCVCVCLCLCVCVVVVVGSVRVWLAPAFVRVRLQQGGIGHRASTAAEPAMLCTSTDPNQKYFRSYDWRACDRSGNGEFGGGGGGGAGTRRVRNLSSQRRGEHSVMSQNEHLVYETELPLHGLGVEQRELLPQLLALLERLRVVAHLARLDTVVLPQV